MIKSNWQDIQNAAKEGCKILFPLGVIEELGLSAKLVLESMDLQLHGWNGNEDFLLVSEPSYPLEWFEEGDPNEQGLLGKL